MNILEGLSREALAVTLESKGIDNQEKKSLVNTLYLISQEVKGVLDMVGKFIEAGNSTPYLYNYLSELLKTPRGQNALLKAYFNENSKSLFSDLPNLSSLPHKEFYDLIKNNERIKAHFLGYVISGLNRYTDSSNKGDTVGDLLGGYSDCKHKHPISSQDAIFYIDEMLNSGFLQLYIQQNNKEDSNLPYHLHSCLLRGNQEQKIKILALYDFSKYHPKNTLELINYFYNNGEQELKEIIIEKSKIRSRLLARIKRDLTNSFIGLRDDIDLINIYGKAILGNEFLEQCCEELNKLKENDRDAYVIPYLSTYSAPVFKYNNGTFTII